MKIQGVSWRGKHYVFAYEQETGSESAPDHREVIICQMDDYIETLKEALVRIAGDIPASRQNTPVSYLQDIAKEALVELV